MFHQCSDLSCPIFLTSRNRGAYPGGAVAQEAANCSSGAADPDASRIGGSSSWLIIFEDVIRISTYIYIYIILYYNIKVG